MSNKNHQIKEIITNKNITKVQIYFNHKKEIYIHKDITETNIKYIMNEGRLEKFSMSVIVDDKIMNT